MHTSCIQRMLCSSCHLVATYLPREYVLRVSSSRRSLSFVEVDAEDDVLAADEADACDLAFSSKEACAWRNIER